MRCDGACLRSYRSLPSAVLQARANAIMTEQTVAAEMAAYGNLTHALGFASEDQLNFMWWDGLQSAATLPGGGGKEFLVGLDPAAYIGSTRGGARNGR